MESGFRIRVAGYRITAQFKMFFFFWITLKDCWHADIKFSSIEAAKAYIDQMIAEENPQYIRYP